MSVCFIPAYTPLVYSKTGVYRGIHYFLIFALKHILWVLVRTASMRIRKLERNGLWYSLSPVSVFIPGHELCGEADKSWLWR